MYRVFKLNNKVKGIKLKKMSIKKASRKIGFPIGLGLDIPNCTFITGAKNETLISSYTASVIGMVGLNNSFKSTIVYDIMFSILDRYGDDEQYANIYDADLNVKPDRLNKLAAKYKNLPSPIIDEDFNSEVLDVTDKSKMYANEWTPSLREWAESRSKDKLKEYTAYSKPGNKCMVLTPTVTLIDTLSKFEPKEALEMLENTKKKGDTNMYNVRVGGFKDKFIGETPVIAAKSNCFLIMCAHTGKKMNLDVTPHGPQPKKQMAFLGGDEYLKSVSPKFGELTQVIFYAHQAVVFKNPTTKLAEYPKPGGESEQATDLQKVRLQPLRSKIGASGYVLPILISQTEGVLPHLSAFEYLKVNGKFGFEGNDRNYNMVLLPDVKLSRTTVRGKIDSNPKLRRTLEILRDLHQLKVYHPDTVASGLWCEPETLYEDLIGKGYNWDDLLNTIEYVPLDSYNDEVLPHLSVVDLLRMRLDDYKPYWHK